MERNCGALVQSEAFLQGEEGARRNIARKRGQTEPGTASSAPPRMSVMGDLHTHMQNELSPHCGRRKTVRERHVRTTIALCHEFVGRCWRLPLEHSALMALKRIPPRLSLGEGASKTHTSCFLSRPRHRSSGLRSRRFRRVATYGRRRRWRTCSSRRFHVTAQPAQRLAGSWKLEWTCALEDPKHRPSQES